MSANWLSLLILGQTSFPRGDGFSFSLYSLAAFLAAYLGWVKLSVWIDDDSRDCDLNPELWNLVFLATGLVAGGLFFAVTKPAISWLLVFLAYLIPFSVYVIRRNSLVDESKKLFTPAHLQLLAQKYLKLDFNRAAASASSDIPMRFLGKSSDRSKPGGDKRIEKAQESAYYQAALEVVYDAFLKRATDVHLEPSKESMAIRLRVDGIMTQVEPLDRHTGDAVINIIKVLADLDISEKRKPQDGSFSAEVIPQSDEDDEDGQPGKKKKPIVLDFRVATAGSVSGEKLVMRILDSSKSLASLKKLGMRDKQREIIQGVVSQPHGMFIVCGPTGAGKSTTLYACLSEIDRFTKNVITLENPVEYQMDNVTQIEVNPKAGKTFASELRSILRQDPDVIYVGEIRDKETAEIACQAAQTGHMVFTTLHANDSVTAIGRLIDLGVAPFMVANAVSGILAQRLVRLLCPKCKIRYKPNPEVLRKFNLSPDKYEYFYKACGEDGKGKDPEQEPCRHCGGTGYRGRTGVFEIFVLSEGLKVLIQSNPSLNIIRQEAIKAGMKYLLEDGLRQVVIGNTSINEILRVCK